MISIPKQKWDGTRDKFMRVLLDEQEIIISNRYQAQKYGGGQGSTGEATRRKVGCWEGKETGESKMSY